MPENTVRKLHPDEPVEKVVATAVSIVVGLTNDRQMTFQSGYEGDESDDAVFARLQRNMRFADRLKAIYEIPGLEEDLERHKLALERFQSDRDEIEERHKRAQAMRQVEIDARRRRAQEAWDASGKRGAFQPQGATLRDLNLSQAEIDKAENEAVQGRENFLVTLKRHQEETDLCAAKLAKAKALAEG